MKIGFLADKIPYEKRRGWGIYSYQLLRALLTIDKENTYHCFYNIFRKGRNDLVLRVNGSKQKNLIWPIPGRIMNLLWEQWRLLAAERFFGRIDVLHVPYEFLPKVTSARTVVTVHDVTFLKHPEYLEPGFVELFTKRIHYVAENADRIIADSENTKRELVAYTDVPEERVVVIHAGVDECFKPTEDTAEIKNVSKRYGISNPYVLFVGAADEDKNLVRLAKAFARVREEQPDLQLALAGNVGWAFNCLMEQLKSLNIAEGVVLTGFVSDRDLPLLYAGAAVLAIPSIHEGFGLPALESMACGTPVLCSDAASLPEVVGNAGVLVDPYSVEEIASGLNELLLNTDLRAECIKKGLERAKSFSWKSAASQVLNVYRELLQ